MIRTGTKSANSTATAPRSEVMGLTWLSSVESNFGVWRTALGITWRRPPTLLLFKSCL
ncbi:hypothetical protein D9M69_682860 [compost metagenome]